MRGVLVISFLSNHVFLTSFLLDAGLGSDRHGVPRHGNIIPT